MSFYSFQEVSAYCIRYFQGDHLAVDAWMEKYALRDEQGNFLELTPDDMHRRLAVELFKAEQIFTDEKPEHLSDYGKSRQALSADKIFTLLQGFRYLIPQGSIMASLGNKARWNSLSNCVVLPEIYDSYGGIFNTDQQLAQLMKRRCGVGIDISSLRPKGATVANAAVRSSGAVSFMPRFSFTTAEVSQDGRRGALMMTMKVNHPDIFEFVAAKSDNLSINAANISVLVSDEFMRAVEQEEDFELCYNFTDQKKPLRRKIKAKDLFNHLVKHAHKNGEPGILFWDRQHVYSTSSVYPGFRNLSTNPCSEIAMQGGDSCRLLAINLLSFVQHPFTKSAVFDFQNFYEITYEAQRLMDDIVELELQAIERILEKINNDPEPENIKSAERDIWKLLYENGRKGRRTGLGFTALADTLAALGITYGSESAIEETERIMRQKLRAEFDASIDLSIERGSFAGFDPETEMKSGFIRMLQQEFPSQYERMMKFGRRNISVGAVAPTGTVSLMTQTSSGIEPVFSLYYSRKRRINQVTSVLENNWEQYKVIHPGLLQWMKVNHLDPEKEQHDQFVNSPYYGATAMEVSWQNRIKMQAVVQKYVTHSISSTINLSEDTSMETVGEIYMAAWKSGLKGITVYRQGSREDILQTDTNIRSCYDDNCVFG